MNKITKFLSTTLGVAVLVSSLATMSVQAALAKNTDTSIKKQTSSAFAKFKETHPNAQIINKGTSISRAPAKPLSAVWVDQVGSTKYGQFEYTKGLYSTQYDHGGTEVVVYTYERGYANPSLRFAKLNGSLIKECDYQAIDEDGDSIIDGFFIGWDASGYENGTFTYKATSTNSPWNTMSTSINIK